MADTISTAVYRAGLDPSDYEKGAARKVTADNKMVGSGETVVVSEEKVTRATRLNDEKVGAMAARYGKTPAQLLIRWNLQLGVVPLPKANHVQHLRDNLNVFDFEISHTDMAKLNGLNEHYSALQRLQYL